MNMQSMINRGFEETISDKANLAEIGLIPSHPFVDLFDLHVLFHYLIPFYLDI